MNWTAGLMNPTVVGGSVLTESISYTAKASQTFKKGELIRITLGGTIAVANPTAATAGSVHGIALANAADYLTGGEYAGQKIPVALFDQNTIIAIQLAASKAQEDVAVGQQTILAVASNMWTVAGVTTGGVVATIVGKPADDQWFDPANDASVDTAPVYVQILDSVLQGRVA